MCEELTQAERNEQFPPPISRRELHRWALRFGIGSALVTTVGGCAQAAQTSTASEPPAAEGETVTSRPSVPTADGSCDAYFAHPATGTHPAVVLWPDILGPRPAYELMAQRLAGAGYAVLLVNPYYRDLRAPVVEPGQGFRDQAVWDKVRPLREAITRDSTGRDTESFLGWLDDQPAVDSNRGAGVMGYCMSGPMAVWSGLAVPNRLRAIASFHGSRMASDSEDSPHRVLGDLEAELLIAIADNDDKRQPEAKTLLKDALANGSATGTVEVYEGANHGWCPPDGPAYNEAQAERAWANLLDLFERQLA